MPVLNDFECTKCKRIWDEFASSVPICSRCQSKKHVRKLLPLVTPYIPPHGRDCNMEGNRRHQAWLDKPSTKARRDAGELLHEKDSTL